ncbi:MAG: TRAP transporter large permease subunit [Alphaproteobacteria bacterium]|nr:TRAP transporter large permease subunit [Alphaproteobacteria bacterium]
MEVFFIAVLVLLMAGALAMGYPVAFALPGSAILTIALASLAGWVFAGDTGSYFAQDGPIQWLTAGVTNFRGIYWEVERDTLIAIPLFVFMGIMLQRSKIAEDLLVTMAQLFGPVPGGLGMSVVIVGALLAATTGIVGATVVAMGLISLPAMLRNNYSHSLATGTIAASGTLGQIIPPSIVLIILADQLSSASDQASTARKAEYKEATGEFSMPGEFDIASTSAGDMFLGAFLPGIVLVSLYLVYILVFALIRPQSAPAVAREGSFNLRFALRVLLVLIPPLALILAVLGSIIMGIATVNQAGAIGAVGAIIMAGYRLTEGNRLTYLPALIAIASIVAVFFLLGSFDLNIKSIDTGTDLFGILLAVAAVFAFLMAVLWSGWRVHKINDTMRSVMIETAKTTSMVFIILLGAAMLTAAFRAFGGEELVKEFLGGLPGGFWTQFVVVMGVIFVLGFFLDFIEIAVVVVPIVAPILLQDPSANITAVWLGVMIGVNMQTSFLTPPFGFALFYLRGVAPAIVKTTSMYKGVVAFIGLQLLGLAIVGTFPSLVNFLPNQSFLSAETAPPPKNPRLQICIEDHLFPIYDEQKSELIAAIGQGRKLDFSYLPTKRGKALTTSYDNALATFDLVADIRKSRTALQSYIPEYRPIHRSIRRIQDDIRGHNVEIQKLRDELRQNKRNGFVIPEDVAHAEARIIEAEAEQKILEASLPDSWDGSRKKFLALAGAEKKARLTYRKNVDQAYVPIVELRQILLDANNFADVEDMITALPETLANQSGEDAVAAIKAAESRLGRLTDTSKIRSTLTRARRALTARNPKPIKAVTEARKSVSLYLDELAWRTRAAKEMSEALRVYDKAIAETIGLRQQDRLPSEKISEIASCLAIHRDISLNF